MPRIWLDATVDDFDLTSQQWRPPVPPIPEEQLSPHTPQTPTTPLRKRRSSMPPPLTREGGVRRKRVTRHKKTPDVISSLVDSLSTISSPAQEHFDAIPSINGSSTRSGRHLWRIRSTEDALRDTRLDYRALGQVGGIIDDAAIPPVIKTAPPPSGFSPITAPKPPKAHTTSLFFGRSSSRTSLQSQRSSEVASIVNPSVDSIARANSTGHDSAAVIPDIPTGPKDFGGIYEEEEDDDEGVAVIPDIRGGSKRHKHRSLMFTPSQERIREKAAQNKRNTVSLGEEAANLLHLPRPRHRSNSPEKRHVFDPPIEEGETTPSRPEEIFGTKSSGKRAVRNAVLPSGASPDVPKRQSSLAHTDGSSFASSSKSRRRSNRAEGSSNRSPSNQSDPKKPPTRETSVSKTDTVPEEAFKLEDDAELDMEVINRIKELKARKELREKEAEALKSLHPPETGPSKSRSSSARRGRSASDPPPPFPNEDSKMLLAHKPSLLQKRASTNDIVRGRNLTVDANRPTQPPRDPSRPKTPITPIEATSLPINYKYVLQTLERESRADKDGSSRASTKASSLKGRPKTLPAGIGGRSAVGRQTTTKSVEKDKDTTSVRNPSPRRATINVGPRANSEDSKPPVRYQKPDDLGFTLEPSLVPAPLAPARNSSKKKKRWSHPDLPLSVDVQGQKSKEKNSRKSRDTEPLAVKPVEPPTPVAEERPSTSDSIDDDIKSFVHAPRLTQKIRHPPTGRTIAFSEVGDPKGHAVFCCVGMGLTRYVTAFYDELAATLKLRLITPDRPGIGESAADAAGSNPLSWPDDVVAICAALHIPKFSILAHSAGAIYALATALRVPQHIRGKVHLLAPWIPPSQMTAIGLPQGAGGKADPGMGQLPKSQRLLRVLPTPFLKVANSSFMTATSASLSPKTNGTPTKTKKKPTWKTEKPEKTEMPTNHAAGLAHSRSPSSAQRPGMQNTRRESIMLMDQNVMPTGSALSLGSSRGRAASSKNEDPRILAAMTLAEQERRREYDSRLTLAIWGLATTNANPAVDLLVCLERTQPIGFRYVDINKQVVIHHGSKDTRVPPENVKWLGRMMRRCEVRILEGEGHGLMASAAVMGGVLTEMAKEWEEWDRAVREKRHDRRERMGAVGTRGVGPSGGGIVT